MYVCFRVSGKHRDTRSCRCIVNETSSQSRRYMILCKQWTVKQKSIHCQKHYPKSEYWRWTSPCGQTCCTYRLRKITTRLARTNVTRCCLRSPTTRRRRLATSSRSLLFQSNISTPEKFDKFITIFCNHLWVFDYYLCTHYLL